MPWNRDLANHAIPFLNQNHPPDNWTSSPMKRGVYFFRSIWRDRHGLGRRRFPAFHWFASAYKDPHPSYCSPHQIVCAARLQVDLITQYNLHQPIPHSVLAMFENIPKSHVAGQPRYKSCVKDIGTFRTVDEYIDDVFAAYSHFIHVNRAQFDPAILLGGLPDDVWRQIEVFLRHPAVIEFLDIP